MPAPRPTRPPARATTPIYQTTSYVFDDVDHAASLFNLQTFGYIYSRIANPTVAVLEERIASLEGGRGAVAAASGHAAQFLAFFTLMGPGDEFVAAATSTAARSRSSAHLPEVRLEGHFVDPTDPDELPQGADAADARRSSSRVLANPGGIVVDLEPVAAIAKKAGIPLIVDNTMATPYLCRPFEWGADIIVHSTTKFLSRPRHLDGRRGRRIRQVRLGGERQVPGHDRARARLSRPELHRDLRRLRVHHEDARGRPARPRPDHGADERVPDPDRHRDAAAAHGPPLSPMR